MPLPPDGTEPARGAPAAYLGAFVTVGIGMSILGPSLRRLAEVTGSTEAALGILFTAASVGYLTGIVVGGRLIVRRSGHAILVCGLLALALGATAVPFARNVAALIVIEFGLGIGTGLVEVPCNSLILWTRGGGALLNALHAGWSVGAMLAPLFVGASIAMTGGLPAAYLAAAALAILPLFALRGRRSPPNPHHEVGHGLPEESRALVALGACFYVAYIGLEAGFAGWIYTFAEDRGLSGATATLLGAAFLGTFAVGRLASIPIAIRVDPRRVLIVDHVVVFAGLGLLLVSGRSAVLIWTGTVILGLGLASLFGSMLTLSERHVPSTSTVTSFYFGGLSVGGMFLPATIGVLIATFGSGALPVVCTGAAAVTLGCVLAFERFGQRRSARLALATA
ncbi:MAG: MFS transporter [Actinomycetota bacterium]